MLIYCLQTGGVLTRLFTRVEGQPFDYKYFSGLLTDYQIPPY